MGAFPEAGVSVVCPEGRKEFGQQGFILFQKAETFWNIASSSFKNLTRIVDVAAQPRLYVQVGDLNCRVSSFAITSSLRSWINSVSIPSAAAVAGGAKGCSLLS